ncbi:glycosyltransferase family 4 protein [Patescibacteria group bacterium]|nr:glycosyltransferase family 4 protein [Patescibacteria group bacterium]
MKILFVATFTPDTNYTRDLSICFNKILKKGDRLYLCGPKNDPVLDSNEPKVDYVWRKGWKFFIDILVYVKKHNPDIIHLQHEFKTYGGLVSAVIFPLLLAVLRLLGYPIVVTSHGIVSPKQVDKKFLRFFNVKPSILSKYLVLGFFHYIYKSILIFSNKVTVHSPTLKKILASYYPPANDNVVAIDHGIREITNLKTKKIQKITKKFPLLKEKNIILIFGFFSPRKGYEQLIQAFFRVTADKTMDDWVLALVGDVKEEFYEYKKKIEKLIKKFKLGKKVLISGYVDNVEIDEFCRSAKIVLIPAVISFNTSGALSLALAYKKPLLVANVKPLADEISKNDFGLLYDKDGNKSLEKQLSKLMRNKKLYKKLTQKLEMSVGKRYWTKIAGDHYNLYQDLLDN